MVLVITKGQKMSATKIPTQFPPTSTATEQGDGVLIHWTTTRNNCRVLCASVESTRSKPRRMVKYVRAESEV